MATTALRTATMRIQTSWVSDRPLPFRRTRTLATAAGAVVTGVIGTVAGAAGRAPTSATRAVAASDLRERG